MILKFRNTNFIKRSPILISDIDINKIVLSNKISYKQVFIYFIGYKHDKNRPLYIFFPQMSAYKIDFDETDKR